MPAPFGHSDRVKDTTTTTGTGNLTLSGTAPTGFVNFNTAFGTNFGFAYAIQTSGGGSQWEVGYGYLSASTTLVRDLVLASSNSGAAVDFSAGSKDVFCDFSSDEIDSWDGMTLATAAGMNWV